MEHTKPEIVFIVIPVTFTSVNAEHATQARDESTSVFDGNTSTTGPNAYASAGIMNG